MHEYLANKLFTGLTRIDFAAKRKTWLIYMVFHLFITYMYEKCTLSSHNEYLRVDGGSIFS